MANPSDTNVLVNDTFGDSYEVVKTVYNNLDTIKAVNENNNLNTFIEGYDDKYSKLLDAVPAIDNVANHMNSITSAVNYSAQAKQAAEDSSGSAQEAKAYSEEAGILAQEAKEANATLESISDDIKVVADNIASVNYVADNMNQVKSVSNMLSDTEISTSIKAVRDNLADLKKVSKNVAYIISVAEDADTIESQAQALMDLMMQAKEDTESLQAELSKVADSKAELSTQLQDTLTQVQTEAQKQLDIITEATKVIEGYLAKEKEYAQIAVNSSDDAIKTLIQCRDVLTISEQSINKLTKKCLNSLQQEYDRQLYKVRAEGDTQALRIIQSFDNNIKDKSDAFTAKCDEIKEVKEQEFTEALTEKSDSIKQELQDTVDTYKQDVATVAEETKQDLLNTTEAYKTEVKNTADKAVADVTTKADETNFNISELDSKVNDVIVDNAQINKDHTDIQAKLATIESLVHTQASGDILFSYKDLSKSENAGSMVVGTTYMNMLDTDKNYLQLNADNNQLVDQTKKAIYVRYYIKSQSGSISYMDRKIDVDLAGYVPYDTSTGITLPYNSSYKVTDSAGKVFPLFKVADDGINFILSEPAHKINYNGSELMNQERVDKFILDAKTSLETLVNTKAEEVSNLARDLVADVPVVNPNDSILEVTDKLINTKFNLQYNLDNGMLSVLGKDGTEIEQVYIPGAQRYLKEASVVKNPSGLAEGTYLLLVFATVSGPETQYIAIPDATSLLAGSGIKVDNIEGTDVVSVKLKEDGGLLVDTDGKLYVDANNLIPDVDLSSINSDLTTLKTQQLTTQTDIATLKSKNTELESKVKTLEDKLDEPVEAGNNIFISNASIDADALNPGEGALVPSVNLF